VDLAVKEFVMSIIFSCLALLISAGALLLSWRADRRQKKAEEREEKSAPLQVKPLIQAKPFDFVIQNSFGRTSLEVINASAYDAYDLSFDLKYEENDWIGEWLKANQQPPEGVLKLGPLVGLTAIFNGSLPYSEAEICTTRKGFNLTVKARWRNQFGRHFETTAKYRLQCTTVGDNRAFTFILEEQSFHQ
jgi:hypothetical protein